MIKATIVEDTVSPQGDRLVSVLATFPRIILAEVNTHRMLGKNTSSSRAIPFPKMVKAVKDNPFIPLAWQKNHSGMQGTEYLDGDKKYNLITFIDSLFATLNTNTDKNSKEYQKEQNRIAEKIELINEYLRDYTEHTHTLNDWWLLARDKAVEMATLLYVLDITKQLANRLLEPFMWTTMLITGNDDPSAWGNFFKLRCPQYIFQNTYHKGVESVPYKSWKEVLDNYDFEKETIEDPILFPLYHNKGAAEIHIMSLAEKIYDAFNESTPRQLKAGEWHIPFINNINKLNIGLKVEKDLENHINSQQYDDLLAYTKDMTMIRVSTAMAARTSYTIVGEEKEVNIDTLIGLHDRLINQNPPHSSPMEHCARAMNEHEYLQNIKGYMTCTSRNPIKRVHYGTNEDNNALGWCRNYRGFIQYRHLIENK